MEDARETKLLGRLLQKVGGADRKDIWDLEGLVYVKGYLSFPEISVELTDDISSFPIINKNKRRYY